MEGLSYWFKIIRFIVFTALILYLSLQFDQLGIRLDQLLGIDFIEVFFIQEYISIPF
jgi:hypothetical protein